MRKGNFLVVMFEAFLGPTVSFRTHLRASIVGTVMGLALMRLCQPLNRQRSQKWAFD